MAFPLQVQCPLCNQERMQLYRTEKGFNKAKAADRMVLCNKCKAKLAGKTPRKQRAPSKTLLQKVLELNPEDRETLILQAWQSLYKSILSKALKLTPEERGAMIVALEQSLQD
jgi:uncharacterized protein YlaI